MQKITNCLAGACALWAMSATPATAVVVRFDVEEISTLLAARIFPLEVAAIEGFLLFDFVDTDEDGMADVGTLIDMRLKAFGPVLDVLNPASPGTALTLGLLPGQVDLLQIPDGQEFLYRDPSSTPEQPVFVMGTAKDPVGTLVPSVETQDAKTFTFDAGPIPGPEDDAFLAIEGEENTGVETCEGNNCQLAIANIGSLPLDLSGPQPPLAVADAPGGTKSVSFEIVGLDTIEMMPASLTGSFSFFLGAFPLNFDITRATGMVVPEPGAGLGAAASLGTLALLSRRRRRG